MGAKNAFGQPINEPGGWGFYEPEPRLGKCYVCGRRAKTRRVDGDFMCADCNRQDDVDDALEYFREVDR